MKKVVIVAIIALFFSGLLFPSRNLGRKKVITINNPIQSSVWKTGFSYTIRWSLPGDTSLLSISLIPQQNRATGLMITPITAKTNNDGNYLWKIPGTIKSGKYIIRISTLNGKIFGNSKGFEIRKKMHAASHELSKIIFMKVLKPSLNNFWDQNKMHTIKWQTNSKRNVKIQLHKSNKQFLRTIVTAPKLTRGQQYSWWIPTDLSFGRYRIKVSTVDDKVFAFSEKFTIRMNLKHIKHIVPVTYTSNKKMTKREIKSSPTTPCPSYPDPGPKKIRVGEHALSDNSVYCRTAYRGFAFFDLTPYKGTGILEKALLRLTKIGGTEYQGAYPNVLDEKWNGDALSLFNVKTHRETSVFKGSSTQFTETARVWLANPNLNYGVVFTIHGTEFSQTYSSGYGYFKAEIILYFLGED